MEICQQYCIAVFGVRQKTDAEGFFSNRQEHNF